MNNSLTDFETRTFTLVKEMDKIKEKHIKMQLASAENISDLMHEIHTLKTAIAEKDKKIEHLEQEVASLNILMDCMKYEAKYH